MTSTSQTDYYQLLGVDREASSEEIKRAYRRQAVKYHPDHNPDDREAEEMFKGMSQAYAVLSDPKKRRRYDQLGHEAFTQRWAGSGQEQMDFGSIGEMLEGLFGEVFGRRSGSGRAPRDLNYQLEISFEEAALGTEKAIEFERSQVCEKCNGARSEPGSPTEACPACRGVGEVRVRRGFFATSRPCSACEGSGTHISTPCSQCQGRGSMKRAQSLTVRIPAGVEDGAVRTVRGAGEQTLEGAGNLHVSVRVKDHPLFLRKGADIQCEVPVNFPQAALGAQVPIPTLQGKIKMKLPAGTQSGRVFRLRGKGLPVFGGYGKGDQLVKVVVEVPENITPRQQELLEQLAQEMGSEAHPQQRSFLDKLKALFD